MSRRRGKRSAPGSAAQVLLLREAERRKAVQPRRREGPRQVVQPRVLEQGLPLAEPLRQGRAPLRRVVA